MVIITAALARHSTPDILVWWRDNAHRFPILSHIARDFLAVPVSGVGVENLFSAARDVCHYRRNRLAPETIEAIMIQMCADRFEMKKDFQFSPDDIPEFEVYCTRSDEEEPPDAYISEGEDAGGIEEDADELLHDDDDIPLPPQPSVITHNEPPSTNPISRPRRTALPPGHFRNLNNGL